MPEQMRLHLLAPEVRCPVCSGDLTFVRVRGYGDLYRCAVGGPSKHQVMHYRKQTTKTCGYAVLYKSGVLGVWTACDTPAAKGGVMAELPVMRFHPLAPEVKCPACGAGLTFLRVRGGYGDLYSCASGGPCRCQVMHYRDKMTKTCGYAVMYTFGSFGVWTACGERPAAKE